MLYMIYIYHITSAINLINVEEPGSEVRSPGSGATFASFIFLKIEKLTIVIALEETKN